MNGDFFNDFYVYDNSGGTPSVFSARFAVFILARYSAAVYKRLIVFKNVFVLRSQP